jgi:hypothetical protein
MPEPIIDPETGKPKEGGTNNPEPKKIEVDEADWAKLNARLDVFEKMYTPQGTPQKQQASQGPSLSDQVAKIDADIDALDDQIDDAVQNQKPIKSLTRKRDELNAKRLRLQIQTEDIAPLRDVGLSTMGELTGQFARTNMPHLEIVKDDYQKFLSQMTPDQRVLPKAYEMAYNYAVGQNVDKILEKQKEVVLREATTQSALDATNSTRYMDKEGKEIPKPEDLLGPGAMAALKEKGQSVDQYYKTLGYEGWSDYYQKNKEYIE